jgi:hypothetical protein
MKHGCAHSGHVMIVMICYSACMTRKRFHLTVITSVSGNCTPRGSGICAYTVWSGGARCAFSSNFLKCPLFSMASPWPHGVAWAANPLLQRGQEEQKQEVTSTGKWQVERLGRASSRATPMMLDLQVQYPVRIAFPKRPLVLQIMCSLVQSFFTLRWLGTRDVFPQRLDLVYNYHTLLYTFPNKMDERMERNEGVDAIRKCLGISYSRIDPGSDRSI